jgi:hypothetical protein
MITFCPATDYNLFPEELLQGCTPIRRQLLGDGHNIKGWCASNCFACARKNGTPPFSTSCNTQKSCYKNVAAL